MHSRLGSLHANNIAARLQLAALYAATSTLLPEPGSGMTGAEMAMQLVRQVSPGALAKREAAHLHPSQALCATGLWQG